MRLKLSEAAFCLNIEGDFPECEILAVRTDHRQCNPGDVFICLQGEKVDGHDFAPAAVAKGARAVIASKDLPGLDAPVLKVDNCVKALGRLAAYWRSKSRAKVIGITGTAGKTTLKETLASILAEKGKIALTEKNHNNQIGMPCAILSASGEEDWWIMEAGISHDGDMRELGEILRPDLAIILNVAPGHVEGLGGKGVAWHKSRFFEYLMPGGIALASADYPDLFHECGKFPFKVNYFSLKRKDTVWHLLQKRQKGDYTFQLSSGAYDFKTPFLGEFGAETALAAAAAADILGIDIASMRNGFARCTMPEQRFNVKRLGAWTIIDDSYNANPLSMRRMLLAAREEAGTGKLFLVLGEMGELGAESSPRHYELGILCAALQPAALFWHGGHESEVREGLKDGGLDKERFFVIKEPADFIAQWQGSQDRLDGSDSGAVVLFKGSRSNRMERFLESFEKVNVRTGSERNAL